MDKYEIIDEELDEKMNSIAEKYFELSFEEREKISLDDYIIKHGNAEMIKYREKRKVQADMLLKKRIIVG